MTIRREIEEGTLTLNRLSKLITSNEVQSKEWNIKLTWGFRKGKLYGRVADGPTIVQEILYDGDYTHVLLARMHYDFTLCLGTLIENKKREIRLANMDRKKKGDGDGPGWFGKAAREAKDNEAEK